MAYERKPGDFALFRAKEKKSDKSPDYTGTWVNADGEECDIAAWLKESKSGQKFFSGKIDIVPSEYRRKKSNSQPAPKSQQQDFGPSEEFDVTF